MNWTRILKDAGIPDSPGRAEVVMQMKVASEIRQTEQRLFAAHLLATHEAKLAAQGDTRKAIRSKVRVG